MLDIKIKEKKPRRESPLDIKKIFPNYFNMWIFRSGVVLMLALLFFTVASNDYNFKFRYNYTETGEINYLDATPNTHALELNNRVLTLTLLMFLLNHIYFIFTSDSLKIPFDRGEWEKFKKRFERFKI